MSNALSHKSTMDVAITILAAVAAPTLTLLIHVNELSPTVAADIGGIIAAAVASWHGGSYVTRNAIAQQSTPDPKGQSWSTSSPTPPASSQVESTTPSSNLTSPVPSSQSSLPLSGQASPQA